MKTSILNFTKHIIAVAAVFGMATNAFAGDIPGAADAKTGDIGRHETASDVNEWVNPENGVYGLHVFAADANPWDSQFFIVFADAVVPTGTPIYIKFEYRKAEGSGVVQFNAQGHANPHAYVNNDGWATLEATEEWQTYEADIEASGEIRTFGVNASIGRENGTLYMRNIVIAVNYDEVVVTKETTADEADMEEAPYIEPPVFTAAPHSTIVDYDKIVRDTTRNNVAKAVFSGRDATNGGKTFALDKTVKYGDDKVFAFLADTSLGCFNPWDVEFFAHWENMVDTTGNQNTMKVLSFDYKVDFEAAGAWNVSHFDIATGAGNQGAKWGGIRPTTEWKHYDDTVYDNWSFDLHLGGRLASSYYNSSENKTYYKYEYENGGDPFNIFLKNVVLTVDGKVVAKSNDLPTVTGTEVTDKIFTEDGLIYFNEESGMALIGYDSNAGITDIVIPNTVTRIADGALLGCKTLKSVAIPNSVTSIGTDAFRDCSSLGSVVIPESVKSVGGSAFMDCSSLKSVSISESLSSIEDRTFQGCTSLTEVTIPNWVRSIGLGAFWGCTSLKSVNIPNSVKSIGAAAFISCSNLTNVTIP